MAKRTIIIKPGEKVILPMDAVIDSIVLDGAINVQSTCDNLPDPSSYKCGYFQIVIDNDGDDGRPNDEESTYLTSIRVGSNTYIMDERVVFGDAPGSLTNSALLNTHVPDQALFMFMFVVRTAVTNRQTVNIYFKTPEAMFSDTELKLTARGTISYYKPIEAECDEYDAPE